jgi:hypothetical protein
MNWFTAVDAAIWRAHQAVADWLSPVVRAYKLAVALHLAAYAFMILAWVVADFDVRCILTFTLCTWGIYMWNAMWNLVDRMNQFMTVPADLYMLWPLRLIGVGMVVWLGFICGGALVNKAQWVFWLLAVMAQYFGVCYQLRPPPKPQPEPRGLPEFAT